jgi:hypothetical protein
MQHIGQMSVQNDAQSSQAIRSWGHANRWKLGMTIPGFYAHKMNKADEKSCKEHVKVGKLMPLQVGTRVHSGMGSWSYPTEGAHMLQQPHIFPSMPPIGQSESHYAKLARKPMPMEASTPTKPPRSDNTSPWPWTRIWNGPPSSAISSTP